LKPLARDTACSETLPADFMENVCILTDSSAIFSRTTFTGHGHVKVMPFDAQPAPSPKLAPPLVEDFIREYTSLGRSYDHILVVVMSGGLNPIAAVAAEAAMQFGGRTSVTVVDSLNVGAGLGLLVEQAAQGVASGDSTQEIERIIRTSIPHIFTLFCIPGLAHLASVGYLSPAQAIVGDMLGLFPIFMLEEGHLSPLEKVRTQRHLIESFQEFMEEFESPRVVTLAKGSQNHMRTRPLRQYVSELFPATPFSEHPLCAPLATLLGPQAIGLTVMDLEQERVS
jgi:DegV family protein with EDD domain